MRVNAINQLKINVHLWKNSYFEKLRENRTLQGRNKQIQQDMYTISDVRREKDKSFCKGVVTGGFIVWLVWLGIDLITLTVGI